MDEALWWFDKNLLYYFNVHLASENLDWFWLYMTQLHKKPVFIYAVVPLILIWLVRLYQEQIWKILLIVALAVGTADILAYRVIKNFVHRSRPFQNEEILKWVRQVGEAHGPSFPSNHTANMFALASILGWFFPGLALLFYFFAVLVGISRMALGVHYPTDVLAGMFLGLFVGYVIRSMLLNQSDAFQLKSGVSVRSEDSSSWRTRIKRMKRR